MFGRAAILALTALAVGCTNDIGGDYDFTSGGGGAATDGAEDGGSGGGGDAASDGGGDAADDGGGGSGGGSGGDDGASDETTGGVVMGAPCGGLDLVFVVDNSETMTEEQMRLISVASGFVNDVSDAVAADGGVRVGVVATDGPGFRTTDRDGEACGDLGASNFWMEPGMDGFNQTLACTLNQGSAGGADQRQIQHLLDTLEGPEGDAFVRDDSLLVVVVVTDQDDDAKDGDIGSSGEPSQWVERLEALKGYKQNTAVVALVGHETPNACPPFQWDGSTGAEIATRILDFAGAFPTNEVGDICALTYGSFLGSTVGPIADACENVAS